MNFFTFANPTELIFGKDSVQKLKEKSTSFGKNVLLVYGGGSVKRNGLYDQIVGILKEADKTIYELSGVEPNPRLSTVHKGIQICKDEKIDFILAIGGGSVIDCTKAIAVGAKFDGEIWDVITRKAVPNDALKFGTVLTLAATGSEMNAGSVITNWETKEKLGWGSKFSYPTFSILDPQNTFTVPRDQTVYGSVDIMSHVIESYFHHGTNTKIQDRFCEGILKTVIETAPIAVETLDNYEARETLLYSGTMALNGILSMGVQGDWSTHNIEHAVSAVTDIPHGGGLAIIFPHWMEYVMNENVDRFCQFAERVFDIKQDSMSKEEWALAGIKALRTFWSSIGAPSCLSEYGITKEQLPEMAAKTVKYGPFGYFKKLDQEAALKILEAAL
ncbi:iron-containing alcohol dehydrogenase [Bacillus sp. AFS041924]|uniref:iron-containing alcohol dehydrogenase n=1 Tax=Bacillus sp. AFS041924 TaxID=2033503 RepID=UPI000BFE53E4|nr:iron-containing alcohol dehydrogenase [Bacillus sp. AFS041924]PGS52401.1 NADH-dependent alcohol dehydrogenase [Bacillus sp. AFS041924]